MAYVFRKIFAPILSRLEHADRHYGLGLLVASCIGTRVRMGFLYRKAISGVFDRPRLGGGRSTIGVTPVAPSPTLIITPDQDPYARRLPCAPSFAKAAPPQLHWRRLATQPTHDPPSHLKDSKPGDRPPWLDLGDKAVHPPWSFKDIADNLDLLQFPKEITTAFDSDNNSDSGSSSASLRSSSSSSADSSKAVVGTVEHDLPSSPLEPLVTPPPSPQSLPLNSPAPVASGVLLSNPLGLCARGSPQGSVHSFLVLDDSDMPDADADADADYWAALNPYAMNRGRYADRVTSPFGNTYAVSCGVGKGAHGKVVIGMDTRSARCVAIKVLNKRISTRKMDNQVSYWSLEKRFMQIGRERQIMHWVQMFESWHDEYNVFFVMELAFGSLRDKMVDDNYDLIEAKLWCREMLCAVKALRDYQIVHSDIKPDNFLIVNGGSVVLSDFGMAQTPEPALPTTADFIQWRAFPGGTPGYYAPQTLRDEGCYVSHATDIFSLGVVFAELLSHMGGNMLWDVCKVPAEFRYAPEWWTGMPQPSRQRWLLETYWLKTVNLPPTSPQMDLIEKMLNLEAPNIDELLEHGLFNGLFDVDGKLLRHHMTPQVLPPLCVEPDMRDLMFESWHRGDEEDGSYGPVRPSFAPIMNGSQVFRSRWLKDSELTKRQLREPLPSDFNWIWPPPPPQEHEPEHEDEPDHKDEPEPKDELPSSSS